MPRPSPATRVIFRLLLRAYPRTFRARHERELLGFLQQQLEDARPGGLRAMSAVWLRTITDLMATAWRLRVGARLRRAKNLNATERDLMTVCATSLRDAARSTRRSWRSLLASAGTLALGVAATTAVFSLVDGVLLRQLPYPDADRLVSVGMSIGERRSRSGPASIGHVFDLRESVSGLTRLVASRSASLTMTGETEPRIVQGLRVSEGFFELLGATARQGRLLVASDMPPDAPPALVLSEQGWRELFGARPDSVGRPVTLDGTTHVVVGIVRGGFTAPSRLQEGGGTALVYLPLRLHGDEGARMEFSLQAVGQLAEGAEPGTVEREIESVLARVSAERHPGFEVHGFVTPLREEVLGASIGRTLLIALLAVSVLLVISCANVSHLLLMRGLDRRREFSVRLALGAGRRRLLAQLVGEGAVVGLSGGAAGAALAYAGVRAFVGFGPGGIPRLQDVSVDLRVLLVTMGVALAAAIVSAWLPALMATRVDPVAALREGGRSHTASRGRRRLQATLAMSSVACATLLVLCAGLFGRSFARLTSVDAGFVPDGLASIKITMRRGRADEWRAFYAELLERVDALPGVSAAGMSSGMPFSSDAVGARMWPATWQEGDPDPGFTLLNHVTPGYFATMAVPVVAGRGLQATDTDGAPGVAVVNTAWVEQFMPDTDTAVGATIWSGPPGEPNSSSLTIVGVVESWRTFLASPPVPTVFRPMAQDAWRAVNVVARAADTPEALLPAMRGAVWSLDRNLPVDRSALVSDLRWGSIGEERFYAALVGVFSIVALVLAVAGIYSTVSSSVRMMTRDIGVRLALGAAPTRMQAFVVRQGVRPALVGIVAGIAAMLAAGRSLSGYLFGVEPADPLTLLVVPAALVLVAAGACVGPAIRAGRTDPRTVLSEV